MAEMIIKKGTMELKVNRNDLVQAEETPDGVAFTFKNKFHLMYTDQAMSIVRKNIIKNATDSYTDKKIVIDFDNKRHPVMVFPDE